MTFNKFIFWGITKTLHPYIIEVWMPRWPISHTELLHFYGNNIIILCHIYFSYNEKCMFHIDLRCHWFIQWIPLRKVCNSLSSLGIMT